jgi:hypothetical protein
LRRDRRQAGATREDDDDVVETMGSPPLPDIPVS